MRYRRNVLRTGDLMPCQRVLAPVTGAGPPQAAETAAAQVPPGWSRRWRDAGHHVWACPYMPLRTVITEGRLSAIFRVDRRLRARIDAAVGAYHRTQIQPFRCGVSAVLARRCGDRVSIVLTGPQPAWWRVSDAGNWAHRSSGCL